MSLESQNNQPQLPSLEGLKNALQGVLANL